jgi:hypothetical protein
MHRDLETITSGDTLFVVCECRSPEHVIQLIANTEKADPTVLYISVQLTPLPWRKRLWGAIRYVFGYQCRYGHWDEAMIGAEEALHVHDFLSKTLEEKKLRMRTILIEGEDN